MRGGGEIGLDYHYENTDKEAQKAAFLAQLELADSLSLPVQLHSRDCAADMLALLKEHASLLKHGFLMHCYSHGKEMMGNLPPSARTFPSAARCASRTAAAP